MTRLFIQSSSFPDLALCMFEYLMGSYCSAQADLDLTILFFIPPIVGITGVHHHSAFQLSRFVAVSWRTLFWICGNMTGWGRASNSYSSPGVKLSCKSYDYRKMLCIWSWYFYSSVVSYSWGICYKTPHSMWMPKTDSFLALCVCFV